MLESARETRREVATENDPKSKTAAESEEAQATSDAKRGQTYFRALSVKV